MSTLCVHFFFSPSPDWEYIDVTTTASTAYYARLSSRAQQKVPSWHTCASHLHLLHFPHSFSILKVPLRKKEKQTQRQKLHHHHSKEEQHSSWVADLAQAENTEDKSAFRQLIANEEKQSTSCDPASNKKKQTQSSLSYSDMGFEVLPQSESASTQPGSETTLNEVSGDTCHLALCSRPKV